MKLVMILMLSALPLYCYAGSGCSLLEKIIADTIDKDVSVEEYQEKVAEFVHTDETRNAVAQFKQCFLSQSSETLANVHNMMSIIYNSTWCAPF